MSICRNSCRLAAAFGLGALLMLPLSCSDAELRVSLAHDLLAAGNFDQAFEIYERLYQEGVRKPAVLSGLGLILTLRPTSIFAGIDLLEETLSATPDEAVRDELVLAYLSLGRVDLAKALIHPDRLSVEQVYSPAITRLRLGLNCLEQPGRRALQNLADLPPHPRRDFFQVLCGLAGAERPDVAEEYLRLWRELGDRRTACEVINLWPVPVDSRKRPTSLSAPGQLEAFLRKALRDCRVELPGQISIQRQRARISADRVPGATSERPDSRSLFRVDIYDHSDPGAELDQPRYPWQPPGETVPEGPYTTPPASSDP